MPDTMPTTNFFSTANEGFVTTLGSSILSGATTVPLTSISGLTNATVFVGIIEPGLAKQQVFTGLVDTVGVQITNVVWVRGANAAHSAGVTIVDYVTGGHHNMATTGILKQHGQDGTHGAITATSSTTTTGATVGRLQDSQGVTTSGTDLYTMRSETFTNFIASGCVWTADAAGSTLNGSMTSGVCYIAGKRLTVASVTAHAFTASKDTYVDFQDNGDGTAKLFYTAATNNAASSALGNSGTTANTIRNAIIVTGAGNIAAASSINQGQTDRVLPIASSVAYSVSDSLGNRIYPNNPNGGMIGYRIIGSHGSSGDTTRSGLCSTPVIVPTGRSVKLTASAVWGNTNTTQANNGVVNVVEDGSTTKASGTGFLVGVANQNSIQPVAVDAYTPTAGLHTYTISITNSGFQMATGSSARLIVELV